MAVPLTIALFVAGIYLFLVGASLGRWDRERQLCEELKAEPFYAWFTLWGASDVSYPTAFRLLFFGMLLDALLWLGVGLVAAEVLHTLGLELRWLGICGLLLLAGGLITRAAVRRKLPWPEEFFGRPS